MRSPPLTPSLLPFRAANYFSGDTRWLVLLDDDSWVGVPRLLTVLQQHDHTQRLQLGDFVPSPHLNATHWKRPFACGGAGTVLSRAAVTATDVGGCMRDMHNSCMQSDWMLVRAAPIALHNITPPPRVHAILCMPQSVVYTPT